MGIGVQATACSRLSAFFGSGATGRGTPAPHVLTSQPAWPHYPQRPGDHAQAADRGKLDGGAWLSKIKAFFERVGGGKPERKKIVLVAVLHHLVRVMGAMLRSGQAYHLSESKKEL